MRALRAWLYDDTGVRFLRRAVAAVFLAALLTFLARGADRPTNPSLRTVPGAPVAPAPPTTAVLPGEP